MNTNYKQNNVIYNDYLEIMVIIEYFFCKKKKKNPLRKGRHNNCFKNSGHCSHTQKKNTVHFKYALSVSIIYLNDSQNQKIKQQPEK